MLTPVFDFSPALLVGLTVILALAMLILLSLVSFATTASSYSTWHLLDFGGMFSNNADLFGSVPPEFVLHSERDQSGIVGGLVNTGNTCFMNSVLQSLASVEPFTQTCLQHASKSAKVISALDALLSTVNTKLHSSHSHSPSTLLRAFNSTRWTADTDQQDAHEFLLALVDYVRTELTNQVFDSYKARVSIDSATHAIATTAPQDLTLPVVRLPLDGLLATALTCSVCNETQSIRHHTFSSIELSLPVSSSTPLFSAKQDSVEISQLLASVATPDVIENVHCQRCSLAAAKSQLDRLIKAAIDRDSPAEVVEILSARRDDIADVLSHPTILDSDIERLKPPRLVSTTKSKTVTIARAPECLVLHINRSDYDVRFGIARKKNTKVVFDDRLALENVHYKLVSTVNHSGSHSLGHYISHRYVDTAWIRVSDRDVKNVRPEDVYAQGNVVLLFYVKVVPDLVAHETDVPIFDSHENDSSDENYSTGSSSVSSPGADGQ
ncbi:hypothetical protein V1512DRAFT_267509 [Lipomyces arxii]|uniref:uncharacterized protein n=1 Tax=Lipomyces arxii TaxID=56418 RepID=UPI0034D0157C